MLCQSFEQLTPMEKSTLIGELVHSFMNDEEIYKVGLALIKKAKKKGLFDRVTINPAENISLN